MTIEEALVFWIENKFAIDAFWLSRPKNVDKSVVFQCLSPGSVKANLVKTGIKDDVYSFMVYHSSADEGKAIADGIASFLDGFYGELNADTPQAYRIQFASLTGGNDRKISEEPEPHAYQFTRDFNLKH
ncbi:hypothetical protein [Vibrio sp. SCSIO 43136]|uniref:hypothetical protein n=1 Tax=Vibrio sp. SCSIO 43136 TaxID=2819101 RepID=UPI0020761A8C|nr:hypothetical protein [Vibrio sp. SCSIO 43136]USD68135.1 hypothetical protein J4N39_18345 [Vibrio sp. SCSIO 43136]